MLFPNGRSRTVPPYTPVHVGAVLAGGYPSSLHERYLQRGRWAWGIVGFPHYVEQCRRKDRTIARRIGALQTARQVPRSNPRASVPLMLGMLPRLLEMPEPAFRGAPLAHRMAWAVSRMVQVLPVAPRSLWSRRWR